MKVLGFSGLKYLLRDPSLRSDIEAAWVEERIAARNAARKSKNFAEADRIRDELMSKGVVPKDGASGTTWELKR